MPLATPGTVTVWASVGTANTRAESATRPRARPRRRTPTRVAVFGLTSPARAPPRDAGLSEPSSVALKSMPSPFSIRAATIRPMSSRSSAANSPRFVPSPSVPGVRSRRVSVITDAMAYAREVCVARQVPAPRSGGGFVGCRVVGDDRAGPRTDQERSRAQPSGIPRRASAAAAGRGYPSGYRVSVIRM